ncbi:MAG: hypothetical protein AAF333_13175 [Planctomycetota bacterium]
MSDPTFTPKPFPDEVTEAAKNASAAGGPADGPDPEAPAGPMAYRGVEPPSLGHRFDPALLLAGNDDPRAVSEKRAYLAMHYRRFAGCLIPKADCPCGARVDLHRAYKCRVCGLWLCARCADEHFGLEVDAVGRVRRRADASGRHVDVSEPAAGPPAAQAPPETT